MPYLPSASSLLLPETDRLPRLPLAQPKWGHVLLPPPSSSKSPGTPCQSRRGKPGRGAEPSVHTWAADEGVVPPPSNRCHLHSGGSRSHQQAEVAPQRGQAVTFIAAYTLPGTAIFTTVCSSGLFVMLKRLMVGVGTEQGGGARESHTWHQG